MVGVLTPPFELRRDPFEVAEIFEVPLAFLMNPANHKRESMHYRGKLRAFYSMPYGDYFIWGATASILVTLSQAMHSGRA